jgi:hypothetical protein
VYHPQPAVPEHWRPQTLVKPEIILDHQVSSFSTIDQFFNGLTNMISQQYKPRQCPSWPPQWSSWPQGDGVTEVRLYRLTFLCCKKREIPLMSRRQREIHRHRQSRNCQRGYCRSDNVTFNGEIRFDIFVISALENDYFVCISS